MNTTDIMQLINNLVNTLMESSITKIECKIEHGFEQLISEFSKIHGRLNTLESRVAAYEKISESYSQVILNMSRQLSRPNISIGDNAQKLNIQGDSGQANDFNAIGDNAIGDNAIGDNAIGDNAADNQHITGDHNSSNHQRRCNNVANSGIDGSLLADDEDDVDDTTTKYDADDEYEHEEEDIDDTNYSDEEDEEEEETTEQLIGDESDIVTFNSNNDAVVRTDVEIIEPNRNNDAIDYSQYNLEETRYIRSELTNESERDEVTTEPDGIRRVRRRVLRNVSPSRLNFAANYNDENDYDEYNEIFDSDDGLYKVEPFDLTINRAEVRRVLAENAEKASKKKIKLYPAEFSPSLLNTIMRRGKTNTEQSVYLAGNKRQRDRLRRIAKDILFHFANCNKLRADEEELVFLLTFCVLRAIYNAATPLSTDRNSVDWKTLPRIPKSTGLRTLISNAYKLATEKYSTRAKRSRLDELVSYRDKMYEYLNHIGKEQRIKKKIFHIITAYKRYYKYCKEHNCLTLKEGCVDRPIKEVTNVYTMFDDNIQVEREQLPLNLPPGEVTLKRLFEYRTGSTINPPKRRIRRIQQQ